MDPLVETYPRALIPELAVSDLPDYENARVMPPDELWIEPGNGGREQDVNYIACFQHVRQQLVEMFQSSNLYGSTENFIGCLKRLHLTVAESGTYFPLTGRNHLEPKYYGQLDDRYGRFSNVRLNQSMAIVPIASRFGDPYGGSDRLEIGTPNTESIHVLRLPGISENNLPFDIVRYDGEGQVKEIRDGDRPYYSQGGYEYMYPDVEGVWEYLDQMRQIGSAIENGTKHGHNGNDLLVLIAKQYQYGACARPFVQINNSLFMQLANMQVKLLGLPGITHGLMDIAAQRMQPDAFARYFVARAQRLEP